MEKLNREIHGAQFTIKPDGFLRVRGFISEQWRVQNSKPE